MEITEIKSTRPSISRFFKVVDGQEEYQVQAFKTHAYVWQGDKVYASADWKIDLENPLPYIEEMMNILIVNKRKKYGMSKVPSAM